MYGSVSVMSEGVKVYGVRVVTYGNFSAEPEVSLSFFGWCHLGPSSGLQSSGASLKSQEAGSPVTVTPDLSRARTMRLRKVST